jgi:hypothetical protein
MNNSLAILPLAITMMLGPQIISAVIFVTGKKPIKNSLAYVGAVGIAATLGTLALFLILNAVGVSSDQGNQSSGASLVNKLVVLLLAYLLIKTIIDRHKIKQPAWMKKLQQAEPRKAAKLGLLLILLMPSDLIVMLSVGQYLFRNGESFFAAIPFLVATVLVAGLPLMAYLIFKTSAQRIMPKVRDWMANNAWVINAVVYIFFIFLLS